ncbi:molybdopterin cofactor-binding domain-containing protein [Inhella sp.]|uniref:xanthine dehydrogenase family protein molybdopterin-binding subunit n=1 Tax=Inhella sp. TaxID=1921806 RepID=UPI0035AFDF73
MSTVMQRRGFLAVLACTSGALSLGVTAQQRGRFAPSAYLRIEPDGRIVLQAPAPDMGQGVKTSLPMLVAEELEVGLDQVTVEQSTWDARMGRIQDAGGSSSVPKAWVPLRQAGATARWLLVSAAAQAWGLPHEALRTKRGEVRHDASGCRASYASLAAAAALLPLPKDVPLKAPSEFRLIGRRQTQVDAAAMVRGAPLFCADRRPEGCLIGVVIKAPVRGARPLRGNWDELKAMPGMVDAWRLEGSDSPGGNMHREHHGDPQHGVALVGRSTWAVLKARRALQVQWSATRYDGHSSAGYEAEIRQRLEHPGEIWRNDGDAPAALQAAATRIDVLYELPVLAHVTMETMSCLAEPLPDGRLRLRSPSQFPRLAVQAAQRQFGLQAEQIELEVPRLGGAFGRRWEVDFVLEACAMALRLKAPVLLFTPREDDIRHDYYRPFETHRIRAGLDAQGRLVAWDQDQWIQGFRTAATPKMEPRECPVGLIPNLRMRAQAIDSHLPDGAYRAPPSNLHAFFVESALNELAHAAGQDALTFRLQWLGEDRVLESGFDTARLKAVLRLAAEKAGWGRPLPKGQGLGLAAWFSHNGYVAQVVELAVSPAGAVTVSRVTAAVDVGPIVNPSGAEQQVQGSIIDALAGALYQQVTLKDGAVQQSNFHDHPLLRMHEVPRRIDVHFIEGARRPTGLGEPAYPPLAPALTAALFAATGRRIRSLPLTRQELSWR